jgi:hypothetical protein
VVALAGLLVVGIGQTLATLRDEDGLVRWQAWAMEAGPAIAAAAFGWAMHARGETLALPGMAALLFLAAVGGRAALRPLRRRWWGAPPAYLLVLTVCTMIGLPMAGLLATTLYAAATLVVAVETLRPDA